MKHRVHLHIKNTLYGTQNKLSIVYYILHGKICFLNKRNEMSNFQSFIYYMQSFSTNKRSNVKTGNKLRLSVHPRLSIGDPYLNIQLALPNPPSLALSTAITSSIFSVSVNYPQEKNREREREREEYSQRAPQTPR